MSFSKHMAKASEQFLEVTKETVIVGGKAIEADVDSISFSEFVQSGGRFDGSEFIMFVRVSDWDEIGGRKGAKVEVGNDLVAKVKRMVNSGDGQYEIVCESPSISF